MSPAFRFASRILAASALVTTLTACGDESNANSEPDRTVIATPALLDEANNADDIVKLAETSQCGGAAIVSDLTTSLGYTMVVCQRVSATFNVFPSSTAVQVYLEGGQCPSGLYYARGPLWTAQSVNLTFISDLIDLGAESLSCG